MSSAFVSTMNRPCARTAPQQAQRASVKAAAEPNASRREMMLQSSGWAMVGAMFTFGATARPSGLGVTDYGGGVKTLGLCPPKPNCVSTAEEMNDNGHYVPAWNYNPADGRAMKKSINQQQAMEELVSVVSSLQPDKFTPKIVKQTQDYLYVEYESPTFGFIDDVEFFFPANRPGTCEYRSASRLGESDGDVNRKRIKAIRQALQKKGWESVGF